MPKLKWLAYFGMICQNPPPLNSCRITMVADVETWIQPLILVTGVVGAVLNAKQIVYGFHIWIVCNLLVIYSSIDHVQYGMTALYGFYIAVCIYGIYSWKKKVAS
jgi:nicotinamide riboside transporter PnuC